MEILGSGGNRKRRNAVSIWIKTFFKIAEFKCFCLKKSSLKVTFTPVLWKFSLGKFKSKSYFLLADQNGITSGCGPRSDDILFIIRTVNI